MYKMIFYKATTLMAMLSVIMALPPHDAYGDTMQMDDPTERSVEVRFVPPPLVSQWLRTLDSAAHLNHYPTDGNDEIRLRLEVQLTADPLPVGLQLGVVVNRKEASAGTAPKVFSDDLAAPSSCDVTYHEMTMGRFPVGEYSVSVSVLSNGKLLGEASTEFSVTPPMLSRVTIDPGIAPVPASTAQLQVSDYSMSRFGGARITTDHRIVHDFTANNSDGTGKFNIFVHRQHPGPLLFMTDLHESPKTPYPFLHFQALPGNSPEIEGRRGVWPSGYVYPADGGVPDTIHSLSTGWLSQQTRLEYPDNSVMDITYSLASPGLMVETNAPSLRCFGGLEAFGLGGPSGLAWEQGGIRTHSFDETADTLRLQPDANWMLAWSNGAAGWEYFDLPWLIVFQHQPTAVISSPEGLDIEFSGQAGRIWLVPLMGQNAVPLDFTADWKDAVPADIVAKCNTLGRLMLSYPIHADEYYRIDPSDQSVTATVVYEFEETEDDWDTEPLRAALVPPAMSLSGAYGFPLSFRETLTDLHMPDAFGPTLVALDQPSVTWKMTGVLDIITEGVHIDHIDFNLPETKHALVELRREVDRLQRENNLAQHPWNTLQNASPGTQPRTVFPLLLELYKTWPYLTPEQQATIGPHLDDEVQHIFMTPAQMPPYRAVNGLQVATPDDALNRLGTDHMAWTSAQLYTIWLRGREEGTFDFSPAEQEFLRTLYNVLLMTSDFSMGGSWDVYTGVRLGGGIQEAAFAMCGHLAWYRMKKDKETRQAELAAYLAARQMPSVFAQFCGNRWVREYIYAVDLANLPAYEKEQQYDWRFAELNELPGLSRSTIVGDNFIFSLILVGMPEIMRFYNRYAKDDALYFLTHQLNPGREMIWWDTRVYPNHMMSFADYWLYIIGADRSKIYDVFLTEPKYRTRGYGQIGNARAVLESAGTIEYREE